MILWDEVRRRLDEARQAERGVVLATHVNADGDGLGSQIAMHQHLRASGQRVWMINNDPVPARYRFLRGVELVRLHDGAECSALIREAALILVMDNSSPARLGRLLPDVQASGAFKICIDHHAGVDPFWDLNCVDEEASASGQLVYEALRSFGAVITPPIAEALYVAFVTDTGHFRFSKTTPEVHRIIADLMEAGGISPPRVYQALFEGISRGLNRLVSHALADAHYDHDGRFAWARLTLEQLQECDGLEEDTSDLVNMLLAVQGVVASAIFKELPEGRVKVSLRSKGDVDVNRVAVRFGGGGHKNASGVLVRAPFDETVRRIVDGVKEVLPPA